MKQEKNLFDRLDTELIQSSYSTYFDWNVLLESVSCNIQSMLNVRQGSVTALADFGMVDFNDVVNQFPDAIVQIRNWIQQFIVNYEPRLSQVNVYYTPDLEQPLQLKYVIEGVLNYQNQRSRVAFDTVLTGSGQATVRI